jgi:3-dehydroquinate dehydratase-2
VIEVHISNIHGREHFRRTSLTAAAAQACISGMGLQGYLSALEALLNS